MWPLSLRVYLCARRLLWKCEKKERVSGKRTKEEEGKRKTRTSEARHRHLEMCMFCQRREGPCTAVDDGSAQLSHVCVCLFEAGRRAPSPRASSNISFQQSVLKCYHRSAALFFSFARRRRKITEVHETLSEMPLSSHHICVTWVFLFIYLFILPPPQPLMSSSFLHLHPSLVALIWVCLNPTPIRSSHSHLPLTPLCPPPPLLSPPLPPERGIQYTITAPPTASSSSSSSPPLSSLSSFLPHPINLHSKHTSNQYGPYQRGRRCKAHRTQRRQEGKRRLSLLPPPSLFLSHASLIFLQLRFFLRTDSRTHRSDFFFPSFLLSFFPVSMRIFRG